MVAVSLSAGFAPYILTGKLFMHDLQRCVRSDTALLRPLRGYPMMDGTQSKMPGVSTVSRNVATVRLGK